MLRAVARQRGRFGKLAACVPLVRAPLVCRRALSAPARAKAPANAVAAAASEAAEGTTLWGHFVGAGLWTLVSLNVGAFLSYGDEGAQLLMHLDEFTATMLDEGAKRKTLEECMERVARGAATNDTLKLRLLSEPGLLDRLLQLVEGDGPNYFGSAKNHAAKVIEAVSAHPEAQLRLVEAGVHVRLLRTVESEGSSLYIKKTLATVLCNLALRPENVPALGGAGAVRILDAEQRSSPKLRRRRVEVALSRLAATLSAEHAAVVSALPADERDLIASLASAEAEAAQQPLHALRASLIESGLLLYLHTAVGGAAWGLFESLRLRQPRQMLVQNVVRTSLVTCFVPILMVGGVVTAYTRSNKATDSVHEKFALYFTTCLALYPCGRLLQWVERFAPLWLGGHIVGFVSFFGWTLYTEADLLKSDAALAG